MKPNILEILIKMIKDSYNAESMREFISTNNIDINALNTYKTDEEKTILIFATKCGDAEVVKTLIEAGADVNCLDSSNGMTPLMHAAEDGHTEIIKILIEANANINENTGYDRHTALKSAAKMGHTEIVKILIKAGADVNGGGDTFTPLKYASEYGYIEIVKILIEAGAYVDVEEDDTSTALMYASEYGYIEIVNILIEAGADVDKQTELGETALINAVKHCHTEIVKILIKSVADLDSVEYHFLNDPLVYAAGYGDTEIANILIKAGADVNYYTGETTPLIAAVEGDDTEIVKVLIKSGANIDATDSNGITALIHAAGRDRFEAIKILIEAGAYIDFDEIEFPKRLFNFFSSYNFSVESLSRMFGAALANFFSSHNFSVESLSTIFEAALAKGSTEALVRFLINHKHREIGSLNEKLNIFLNEYDSLPEQIKSQALLLYNNKDTKPSAIQILAEEFNKIQANKLEIISRGIVRNTSLKKVTASYDISKLIIEYSGLQKEWDSIPQLEEEQEKLNKNHFDNQYKDYLFGIEAGNVLVIKTAIIKSININLTDSEGDSILHIIVSQANIDPKYIPEIIDLLIKKGINFKIKNIHGKTALDIAKENFAISESKFDEEVIRLLEGCANNNITGKKRLITDAEIVTESLEPSQNNKFKMVEEQNQESSDKIQNHISGQEISLSMGIIKFQHNLVQEDQRRNYFSAELKILDILIPKFTINSIVPKEQLVNQRIEAKAKLPKFPTYEEPKLAANSGTEFYPHSSLLTGIKALDVATDLFKTIYQPTTENLNIFMIDTAYLGVMITDTSRYLPLLSLADMSEQASNGEYEKALIQGIVTGVFMLLPIATLGKSLVPACSSAIIAYAGYKTISNIYSLYSNYGTPEFQLRSNLAYSNLSFKAGFVDWAKGYLNDAEILIREDLELNSNPNSEIQQIALEYDFAGMLFELESSH